MLVAQPGGSVLDDLAKDLAFTSEANYMLLLSERTDTSDGSGNLTITHNLGYMPAFYHFYEESSGVWRRPIESGIGGSYATNTQIFHKTPSGNQRVRTVIWANAQSDATGSGNNNVSGHLKIAKDGYDVSEETDLRRFNFASLKGTFKIKEKKRLQVTVSGTDTTDTASYAHGLGYVPQVYVFVAGIQIPSFYFIAAGTSYEFNYYVTNTHLVISVTNAGGAIPTSEVVTFDAQILLDKID